ncbi:MAG: diguanylate cyclase [Gammaproteobacteria bacterium]|nr:diguanylate cyclase [Gammaproteobacteria bacterium]
MTTQRMPAIPSDPELGGAPARIVICSVDAQRRILLTALARTAFDNAPVTQEADSGDAVLELVRNDTVDCVITDENLSGMSAGELLGRMQAQLAAVPSVIVLADTLSQPDARALIKHQVTFVCPLSDPTNVGLRSALRTAMELQQLRALLSSANDRNQKHRDQLQDMQQLDPLTGLMNSQTFYQRIETEFRRSARSAQPLSLLLADIDCFTAYNYAYGQEAGDQCLCKVATAIDGSFKRAGDQVARFAGASFAVLLADTDNDDVATQAERLRQCVWNLELQCNSSKVADRVTLSVGVATTSDDFDNGWEYLLQTAQNALFHAKAQGRNWVEVAAGM